MVDGEASIHNIMGGMESTGGVRLHNHKRKLKQRFDIIKKLGQGTYGKVQLGINKETGQEVAIKTIKKCKIETEADLIRIRREIQIMSSVQHPNIIHIYEVFENREKMVLVMEYAAGGELYDYLSEHKVLTEMEARRIFRQISTAVFYCHKHKICHRDLKLENILLDQSGNAKIADFGLSNVFDERRLLNTFCGSALYASPEIVNGTPYHGPEVDCWSLGVLLYTLVYGAMPFDGTNFKRLVKQISESDYREPKKPSRASPLIKAMLTVSPARRADIEKICTHWWVNEGYEQNCLDIAEELAAQTPVRLDLLLSLVPQSASAEKLVVGSEQTPQPPDIADNMSSETLMPTRCHSVGSLMELDRNNSDRRIREMVQEEAKAQAKAKVAPALDSKRKLETTPSTEETTAVGVKRKERAKKKETIDDRDSKAYRTNTKHHSAPIPNSIVEEAMDIDQGMVISVPISKTVDLKKAGDSMTCLELIEGKQKEKSPNRERRKTPSSAVLSQMSSNDAAECETVLDVLTLPNKSNENETTQQELASSSPKKIVSQLQLEEKDTAKVDVPKEKNPSKINEGINNNISVQKNTAETSEKAQKRTNVTKKLRNKSLSLDCDLITDDSAPKPTTERRRSKIFETAEKFNQLASPVEPEKPKKIFIPGVNVGGAKLVFERKASLSSAAIPQTIKAPVSKVIIDVPTFDKQPENGKSSEADVKMLRRDEEKRRAVDIITGALGKPPMLRKASGSPPISPQSNETKKLGLKIPLGPNDVRNATITVTTPTETKFPFEPKSDLQAKGVLISPDISSHEMSKSMADEPKKCSKMEITLKSATLPRPHKTSKAEIILAGPRPVDAAFRSEIEAKIDAFQPQKLRSQRSEIAFPVAPAMSQAHRSSSLEPATRATSRGTFGERLIPIQMEPMPQQATVHSTTPPPKPPMTQRSLSQRSSSLSRQSTADSDTDSALGSTIGPEPIRKSPREYIIPIAVEGGGYVTPRSGSLEPESKNGTPTGVNPPRSRFSRPRRMGSLLSDASEDESPFSSLHRDNEDLLQRHMHRLRSSRPPRQASEHADSLSSGEDDDDDGFELLTAENLFSTLLSRVRSLTKRLNVDDNRSNTGFPSSRILGRFGSNNSSQGFWGVHEPLSRRISDSQFRRTMSRDNSFGCKESSGTNSPITQQNSPGTRTSSRDSLFDVGSNTLPRAKSHQQAQQQAPAESRPNPEPSPEHNPELNFTPSLARRLSRHFIERTRQSLPRDATYLGPLPPGLDGPERLRSRSQERASAGMRRANSLLEPTLSRPERRSPRRSISLFDDEDRYLPPLPLGRKYRDSSKLSTTPIAVEKIQEEPPEEPPAPKDERLGANPPPASSNCREALASGTDLASPIGSTTTTSHTLDRGSSCRGGAGVGGGGSSEDALSSRELHSRLLAAENLIKESKLKNLGLVAFNPNLNSNYRELDKCDKEFLGAMSETASAAIAKRRSCIPSLRLRSGSLSRESSLTRDRCAGPAVSQEVAGPRALTPERSLLSKLFGSGTEEAKERPEAQPKPKLRQRRISRFLRPDFFDTPREESQYVKEKEALKAAENERRKSRFMKRKSAARDQEDEGPDKDGRKETSDLAKGAVDELRAPSVKASFLQTLERKLEKFRYADDASKASGKGEQPESSGAPAKRTSSASDLSTSSACVPTKLPPKSKVNSVLGLFKNSESSSSSSSSRANEQSNGGGLSRPHGQTILSRLRKSPYKGSSSDGIVAADSNAASKIPTKFAKADTKSWKKPSEPGKSPEKSASGFKRSPSKEKEEASSPKRVSPEAKKPTMERLSKSLKRSPEKLLKGKVERTERSLEGKKDVSPAKISEKKKSLDGAVVKKNCSPDNAPLKCKSPEMISNGRLNEETEMGDKEEKGGRKLKIKVLSSAIAADNTSYAKPDSNENGKGLKKVFKPKEAADKDKNGAENTKKKRIVQVVRKVVKKSSDCNESSEGRAKPAKSTAAKTALPKTDKNLEASTSPLGNNARTKSPESPTSLQNEPTPDIRIRPAMDVSSINQRIKSNNLDKASNYSVDQVSSKLVNEIFQPEVMDAKPSREKLKLDFSKIPQHNFRNITPPRRESPKSETARCEIAEMPKFVQTSQSGDVAEKLMENLPKTCNRTTASGNKISADKCLRAKDTADSRTKSQVSGPTTERKENCARTNEPARNEISKGSGTPSNLINNSLEVEKTDLHEAKETKISTSLSKNRSSTDDLVSPTEDTESFDSWSICSADINHTQGDLHSPTYSMYIRRDHPNTESVIDRIRRKSFYSRFNDRKRKASLNAPSPGLNMSSSVTLPRKFSFHSARDINKDQKNNKANNYTLPSRKNSEKSYSMYNDDAATLFRKSPIERDRYSDGGSSSSYSNDLKSPSESYGHISSSYDPLRKYLSPTFNSSVARRQYHSSEFSTNNDLGSYRNSSLTDSMLEPNLNTSINALPRRYGRSVSGFEPKTVEYYEELLAPNNTDYLRGRRVSPLPYDNYNKFENGYHNGSVELPQINTDKWKSHSNKTSRTDLTEGIQGDDCTRKLSQSLHEQDDLSSNSLDQQATIFTAE